MIIRCPNCEHSRSIPESKIPPTAELATCPKCKNRFRFRTLRPVVEPETTATAPAPPRAPSNAPSPESPKPEIQRPQSALQETAPQEDIWDAMDALNQRWQKRVDTEEKDSGHFIFPYSSEGRAPEERVEQDIRMLRDAPPERPLRDLGTMREFPDSQSAESLDEDVPLSLQEPDLTDNAIPWENPARNGWLRGFAATLHGAMFKGPEFFSGFNASGSLTPGYLFFLIMGYVTIIGSLAWTQAAVILLPDMAPMFLGRIGLPALLILAPLALGLMLLFITGCIRISLRILSPTQADFVVIYKVVSYAVAPFILSIAPFLGPPLGALWFLVCLSIGCRNALGLSWPLAVLVPLPPALILLFGLAWFFL
jgi:predicted Zn finger-like uncharacterized protein